MKLNNLALWSGLFGIVALTQYSTANASVTSENEQIANAAKAVQGEHPIPSAALINARTAGRAVFTANGLTLVLQNGRKIEFVDRKSGCPATGAELKDSNCQRFQLAADLPIRHFFLVRRQDYEGGAWILVDDRSGKKTEIDGVPYFAPDGQQFLIQNDDVATEHENNLEIWLRQGSGAVIEWAHPVKQAYVNAPTLNGLYHTELKSWRGNNIALVFSTGAQFDVRKKRILPAQQWNGNLIKRPSGWTLTANWPKPKNL